ncbi:Type I restriction-modification system, specificity subunit S [Vibrio chagasii]|nr:Type I restriction-modification system, specificity subunit S [Vibrio chagasii]CAH7240909.1 Type I restriction-modification system, specificity subunit S [Vibrio chagasii]CAH7267410.1 Type I restriction-modification system, specificity subunit S [Vibrio chagasii]CAH7431858.1 Type I restriction-modification system, specificity subunit S [Vibrio chagasii]
MSWVEKSLGEVLKLEYGKPLDKSLRKEDGKYPAYGANGIKAWSDEYFHDEETIVVGRKGSAGELTLTDGKFWPLDVTYFVKTNKNDYDIKFLYYLLLSLDLPSLATGVKPGINRNNVYKIQAKFPSRSTQKQLVAQLDKAFADIEQARLNTEQNLRNARELFDSYLQQAFCESGDRDVKGELGEFCFIKHGFAFKSDFFVEKSDYVLLTPGNFYERGGYRDRGEKQKYYGGDIPQEYILDKGALLVAMTEQAVGLLGATALIHSNNRFLHNQRLGLVKLIDEYEGKIDLEYLFHLFNTNYFRNQVQKTATGVKVRHTSPKKLMKIEVAIPKSIATQKNIVNELNFLHSQTVCLEDIYTKKLTALDELKQSLLQQLLVS